MDVSCTQIITLSQTVIILSKLCSSAVIVTKQSWSCAMIPTGLLLSRAVTLTLNLHHALSHWQATAIKFRDGTTDRKSTHHDLSLSVHIICCDCSWSVQIILIT